MQHTLPSTRRKGIGATGNHATFGVKQIYAGGKFRAIHARRIYAVEIESGGPVLRHCDQSPRPHGHVAVGIHGKPCGTFSGNLSRARRQSSQSGSNSTSRSGAPRKWLSRDSAPSASISRKSAAMRPGAFIAISSAISAARRLSASTICATDGIKQAAATKKAERSGRRSIRTCVCPSRGAPLPMWRRRARGRVRHLEPPHGAGMRRRPGCR